MRERNPQNRQKRPLSYGANPLPWRYFVLIVICGCVLAAGFFFAARQHFTSMEFGIKNSRLRKQLEDLETENRRLLLAKEASLSPSAIKRAARNLGFRELEDVQNGAVAAASNPPRAAEVTGALVSNKPAKSMDKLPSVTRITLQRPAKPGLNAPHATAGGSDNARKEKQGGKPIISKEKKERSEITTIAKLR